MADSKKNITKDEKTSERMPGGEDALGTGTSSSSAGIATAGIADINFQLERKKIRPASPGDVETDGDKSSKNSTSGKSSLDAGYDIPHNVIPESHHKDAPVITPKGKGH